MFAKRFFCGNVRVTTGRSSNQNLTAFETPYRALPDGGKGSGLIAAELLLLAVCAALWAPDTPIGKAVRVVLIDRPAETLSRATPLKVIVGLIVFLALVVFIVSAPEFVAIMGLGDLSIYLNFTIISMLVSTGVRLKSLLAYAIRLFRGIAPSRIRQRERVGPRNRLAHPRRPKSPPSDDEGGAEWGWAVT
jgi:hypothetical protein